MSATMRTVGELKKMLDDYPDDMLVVVPATCETGEWKIEGTLSGLEMCTVNVWEVRTGWHVLHPQEVDPDLPFLALMLGDYTDSLDLLEAQDEVFGGPSSFATRTRKTWNCEGPEWNDKETCGGKDCLFCDGTGKVWR